MLANAEEAHQRVSKVEAHYKERLAKAEAPTAIRDTEFARMKHEMASLSVVNFTFL